MAELEFCLAASRHGLIVSKPWGDSSRYDFVADNGRDLFRVQVRSTGQMNQHKYMVKTGYGSPRKYFRREDFHFMAVLVIPQQTWYIIPVSEIVDRKNLYLPANLETAHSRLDPFRGAWGLLQPERSENPGS